MNNEQVLKAFLEGREGKTPKRSILNGCYSYEGRTLETDGDELVNYSTIIGYKKDGKLYLNKDKYSVTTSKIQSKLSYLASNYYNNNDIVETTEEKIAEIRIKSILEANNC